jgi:putative redox protein
MPEVTTTISQIETSSAGRTRIRDHELVTDRPVEKGGGNQGPMGGELLVASLGGCFMSNLIAAFHGRDLQPEGLAVTVRGTLDGTPPRFQKMAMEVQGKGIDRDQMEKMILIAERGCIVANTLKQFMPVEISIG